MELHVRERTLPGIGMRYEIDVADGRRLFVIAHNRGQREIGLMSDSDEPDDRVVLDQQSAVMVASLLLGARFTVDTSEGAWVDSDEVVVEAVELQEDSPAIGLSQAELDLDDPEAIVLAVMSDTTSGLVESEAGHVCQVGDHVVVGARAARLAHVIATLEGRNPRSA